MKSSAFGFQILGCFVDDLVKREREKKCIETTPFETSLELKERGRRSKSSQNERKKNQEFTKVENVFCISRTLKKLHIYFLFFFQSSIQRLKSIVCTGVAFL